MTARRRRQRPAIRRRVVVATHARPPRTDSGVVALSTRAGVTWKRDVVVEPTAATRAAFLAGHGLPIGDEAVGADPLLAIGADAWRTMMDHAGSAPVEVGGLLVGEVFRDEHGRLLVDAAVAIPALGALQEAAYFRLTEAAWEHISRERAALHPDLLTVGWYHTHPGMGVFFSGTDRASQRAFFNRPWNVGLVIDPLRDEIALFRGADSERLSPVHLVVYATEGAGVATGDGVAAGTSAGGWRADRIRDTGSWSVVRAAGAGSAVGARVAGDAGGRVAGVGDVVAPPAGLAPAIAALTEPATASPEAGDSMEQRGNGQTGADDTVAADLHPVPVRRPAPIAVPWAPLGALAGAAACAVFAARAGQRRLRGRR